MKKAQKLLHGILQTKGSEITGVGVSHSHNIFAQEARQNCLKYQSRLGENIYRKN